MANLSLEELYDLQNSMVERMGNRQVLEALTVANRKGTLLELLSELGMDDLIQHDSVRMRKILIVGDSRISIQAMVQIAADFGIAKDQLEFELEYNRLKHRNFSRLKYNDNYRAVLIGPTPHSTPGKGSSSSVISEMEQHPEIYPQVVRIGSSGDLKITKKAFKQALAELVFYESTDC